MNEAKTGYEIRMAQMEKITNLKIRVAKLLADEKCTVDEAESVLNEANVLFHVSANVSDTS